MTVGPSLWGHDRTWLPDDQRAQARAMRLKAARDGMREPVNVIEGNYHRMQGVCPWWEGKRHTVGKPIPARGASATSCAPCWRRWRRIVGRWRATPLDPPTLIA